MSENSEKEAWLCRNCNTLVSNEINICPACSAERPEEADNEATPEGIESVIEREYGNSSVSHPGNFR